jgi:hypothetical protein
MSRYMLNKFLRTVEMSDADVRAYVADPVAYVAGWLQGAAAPHRSADDRVLTPQERRALETKDYAELYRLGTHPYLLWHFTEAVHPDVPWPELVERYRAAVAPLGHPDAIV